MTETPLDILADWLMLFHSVIVTAIAISAAIMGVGIAQRRDSFIVCLIIAVMLFFAFNGFFVALIGFNPFKKITAITLLIARSIKELFHWQIR